MAAVSRLRVSALAAVVALMAVACGGGGGNEGGGSTPTSPTETETGAVSSGSTPTSPTETETGAVSSGSTLDQLYADAMAEGGEITLYHATGAEAVTRSIIEPLSESYPDLNVELFSTGSTSQMAERVLTETSAGVHTADVIALGGPGMALLTEADVIASYDSPSHDSLRDPDGMVGPNDTWVALADGMNIPVVNTDALSEADWPSDWTDFATPDPAWGDQIGMIDPRVSGAGYAALAAMYQYYGDDVADSIFEGLAGAGVRLYPSATGVQEAITTGEIVVSFSNADIYPLQAIEAGAPVAFLVMDSGPISSYSTMGILKDAPHPAGAKFMYEWLISEEGQSAQARLQPTYPVREGVQPLDAYPPLDTTIVLDDAVAAERQEELLAHWISIMGF